MSSLFCFLLFLCLWPVNRLAGLVAVGGDVVGPAAAPAAGAGGVAPGVGAGLVIYSLSIHHLIPYRYLPVTGSHHPRDIYR